jgi:hypothetical protein
MVERMTVWVIQADEFGPPFICFDDLTFCFVVCRLNEQEEDYCWEIIMKNIGLNGCKMRCCLIPHTKATASLLYLI